MDGPRAKKIVIGLDPAVTARAGSDETGIVVACEGTDGYGYVLDDLSGIYSPNAWANKVVDAYDLFEANYVVAEVNNGGDLVENVLRNISPTIRVKQVRATRGKEIRADPVVALYEQHRIFHTRCFPKLEEEMTQWTPGDARSPSRVDALVWALTFLFVVPRRRGSVGFA